MGSIFLAVLNMSVTGAFVIAAVCVARLPLKKAPKVISYCLWAVAGFRLLCPVAIKSAVSLVPDTVTRAAVSELSAHASAPYMPNSTKILAVVWLVGACVMLLRGVVSYMLLKRKLQSAVCVAENVYESDVILSAFTFGIFAPKIYLPQNLSERERECVIWHERVHIGRRDYLVKSVAYLVLCLHWLNPLAWVAFFLMSTDMEMSCDERVLKEANGSIRRAYSLALITLATERRVVGLPLAFGGGSIKGRVKNIMNFKKGSKWIAGLAATFAVVVGVGCAVDAPRAKVEKSMGLLGPAGATIVAFNTEQNETYTYEFIEKDGSYIIIDQDGNRYKKIYKDYAKNPHSPFWVLISDSEK